MKYATDDIDTHTNTHSALGDVCFVNEPNAMSTDSNKPASRASRVDVVVTAATVAVRCRLFAGNYVIDR